ncbi:MAG: hypothetical protein ACI4DS_06500 [Eubacterium sp.]
MKYKLHKSKNIVCLIILFIIIVITGISICINQCFSKCKIDEYAQAMLNVYGADNSRIIKLGDYKKFTVEKVQIEYKDISDRIIESLEYDFILSKLPGDAKIEKGNFVNLNYEILDNHATSIESYNNIYVYIGGKYFEPFIEQELVGKDAGYVFTCTSDKIDNNYIGCTSENIIVVTVNSVFEHISRSDDDYIKSQLGFNSFDDYYNDLYNTEYNMYNFEQYSAQKTAFISNIINESIFDINDDDIVSYSKDMIKEYQGTESIVTEDFEINNISFFEMVSDDAQYDIKKCLIIGAMAEKNNITLSDDIIQKAFQEYGYEETEEADYDSRAYIYYNILENVVVQKLMYK